VYLAAKVIHLVGAILFIGNIVTAALWKLRADASRDPRVVLETVRSLQLCDWVFTAPGVALLLGSGLYMANQANIPIWSVFWLRTAFVLLNVTGVLWAAVLLPLQRAIIREATRGVEMGQVTRRYRTLSLVWNAVGTVATVLPLINLYLMIARPR